MNIDDIAPLFPTEEEMRKKRESLSNSPMMSISESIHYPDGFIAGARWAIEKIKEKLEKIPSNY